MALRCACVRIHRARAAIRSHFRFISFAFSDVAVLWCDPGRSELKPKTIHTSAVADISQSVVAVAFVIVRYDRSAIARRQERQHSGAR